MGRISKRLLAQRARARHAVQKLLEAVSQRRNQEIKIEPVDVVVKEETKDEDDLQYNYDNGEENDLVTEQWGGDKTDYSDGQNSATEGLDEAVFAGTPTVPAFTPAYSATTTRTVTVLGGQGKHCLLCYQECDPLEHAIENEENTFRTMFLMKKMLQVPNHKLEDYLLHFGSPIRWVTLCVQCKAKVDKALDIQKQISQLERTLRNFQAEIVDTVKMSMAWLPKISSRSKEHERRVADETRTFVSTGSYQNIIIRKQARKSTVTKADKNLITVKTIPFGSSWGSVKTKNKSFKPKTKDKDHLSLGQRSYPATSTCVNPESSVPTNVHDNESNAFSSPTLEELSIQKPIIIGQVEATPNEEYHHRGVPLERKNPSIKRKSPSSPSPLPQAQAILSDPMIYSVKSYACNLCPHVEKMNFHSFIIHILFHHKRPYRCSVCQTYYASHKELDHSPLNKKRLKEETVGHVCTTESVVRTKFPPERIWSCEHCSELFDLEPQRDEHTKEVHPSKSELSSDLKHRCITCGSKFGNLKDWSLHRAIEHPVVAVISCYFCDENFGSKTKEGIDLIACRISTIKDHVRKQHINCKPSNHLVYSCDFCGQNFMRAAALQKHVKEDHDLNINRTFSCSICFTRLETPSKLRAHLRNTHKAGTEEKYVCDSCGYSVSQRMPFEVHNLQVHGIRPERGVRTCKIDGCTFEYLCKPYYDRHMMQVHNAARKHTCQFCGKGFLNSTHRREHEKIHVNKVEKPFKCKICGNSFALRNYLYIHMRLSHLNRPFASTNKKRSNRKRLSQVPSRPILGVNLPGPSIIENFNSGQDSSSAIPGLQST